jgi:hypothetical protein
MRINFGFNDIEEYQITVKLGDTIIQNQIAQLPSFVAQQQFLHFSEQIARDDRPMQIKFKKLIYTEKDKPLEQFLAFENNAYVRAFGEEKEKGDD